MRSEYELLISGETLRGYWGDYKGDRKHIVVPDGIKIIGDRAFDSRQETETVEIPEGVEEIGEYAFRWNQNLVSVKLPSTLKKIGKDAFYECEHLKGIDLPMSLQYIGDSAFKGCCELRGVDYSFCEEIGLNAFSGCRGLADDDRFIIIRDRLVGYFGEKEKLVIPEGIRILEDRCCMQNTYIREVILPESVETIGFAAFARCENLATIVIPQRLKAIDTIAFLACKSLKRISIPKSVERIGDKAFDDCIELETVDFDDPYRIQIGTHAFNRCKKYATHNGLIIIGNTLHQYIGSERIVHIPEGVSSISDMAFAENETIKEVVFPTSLELIGNGAFWRCESLSRVTWHDGIKEIGGDAFSSTSLKSVVIPKTVQKMGIGAFGYCGNITVYDSIDPNDSCLYRDPDGVTYSSLSAVAVEPNVTLAVKQRGKHPWTGHYITVRYAQTGEIKYKIWIGASAKGNFLDAWRTHAQFNFKEYDNPTKSGDFEDALRYCYCRFEYPFELTDAAKGKMIKYLQKKACSLLKLCISKRDFDQFTYWADRGVIDDENFAKVYNDAQKLSAKEYVDYLDAYKLRVFPDISLKLDTWEFTKSKPVKVTRYNGSDSELVYPTVNGSDKVVGIGARNKTVPDNYHSIRSIVIPEGYELLGKFAFYGLENLETVVLPHTIKVIEDSAFENCSKLKEIKIPKGVNELGFRAFRGCKELKSIVLPSSVEIVREECFYKSGLKRVAIRGGALNKGSKFWRCFPKGIEIFCNAGVVKRYGEFEDKNVHPLEEYPES